MLEPSNPMPSVKEEASIARVGMLKCCHVPGTSVNFRSIMRAPCSRAMRSTSSGVLVICFSACSLDIAVLHDGGYSPRLHLHCAHCTNQSRCHQYSLETREQGTTMR